jgi:hypothetical protein
MSRKKPEQIFIFLQQEKEPRNEKVPGQKGHEEGDRGGVS